MEIIAKLIHGYHFLDHAMLTENIPAIPYSATSTN